MLSESPLYGFLDRQLALLGDQPPLDILATTAERLSSLLEQGGDWGTRSEPEKWSPLEILTHLRDMELVFGFRLRTILHDDRPRLMGISQDRWNEGGSTTDDPAGVVADFAALRGINLKVWRGVQGDLLGRVGLHDEAGVEISLDLLRRIQAGHDLSHLKQIEERLK